MALQTLAAYKDWASVTTTAYDTSYAQLLDEVSDAVKKKLRNPIESASYDLIVTAPPGPELTALCRLAPIQASGFQLYLNRDAKGAIAAFTSDYLLTANDDYILDLAPDSQTYSRSGIVRYLKGWWSNAVYYGNRALQSKPAPAYGTIRAVFTAGYSSIPSSLQLAINLAVSALFLRRKLGTFPTSESLNGYSRSLGKGPGTAESVLESDEIAWRLKPFENPVIYVG